jgi:hypothetical protein
MENGSNSMNSKHQTWLALEGKSRMTIWIIWAKSLKSHEEHGLGLAALDLRKNDLIGTKSWLYGMGL